MDLERCPTTWRASVDVSSSEIYERIEKSAAIARSISDEYMAWFILDRVL
jgi:hypothetical protein